MDGRCENMMPAAIAGTEFSQLGRQEIENYLSSQPADDLQPAQLRSHV